MSSEIENILKRARTCKRRRNKWEYYQLYRNDIGRLGLTPDQYQAAIKQLTKVMKV